MRNRTTVLTLALLLLAAGSSGVHFSSATWSDASDHSVIIGSAADWTPPTVAVDDPGPVVGGAVTLTATASDATSALAQVSLAYAPAGSGAWVTICTDAAAPWACPWDTTALADGPYDLRATATDTAGNSATSATVGTTVAHGVTVALGAVPSPTRGPLALSATVVGAGGAPTTLAFQYAVAGGSTWQPGCAAVPGPAATCTLPLTSGTWDVRVVATVGGDTLTDTRPGVLVDLTAPTATLVVPAGPLAGTVQLGVTAADAGSGVASVVVQHRAVGGTTWTDCGTDTTAPYACPLDTAALPDGVRELRAVVTDVVGNSTTTPTESRVVDNGAPVTTLTVPSGPLSGTVSLTATATDPGGVVAVTFEYRPAGGSTWSTCGTDTSAPWACALGTGGLANGTWELRAVAVDTAGHVGVSTTETRTVSNSTTVSITSPAAGAAVRGTVTVTAAAASTLGVASVGFEYRLSGATTWSSCGTADTAAPYTCGWTTGPLAEGTYELRATLTTGAGTTTTSAPVAVVVRRLRGVDVQGAVVTNGTAGATDTISLTWSGLVDLATIKAGWTGGSTAAPLVLHHSADGTPLITGKDYLTFTGVNLGQVAFSQNFINSQSAAFGNATMVATTVSVDGVPATRVTVTFGAPTSDANRLRTTPVTGALQWVPSGSVADADGNTCAVTTVTESGGNDADL